MVRDKEKKRLAQSMETMEGALKHPRSEAECLPTAECLSILQDILYALDHTHEAGVAHGDVKPSNILFKTDSAGAKHYLLGDWDGARKVAIGGPTSGTIRFASPERLRGEGERFAFAWDVWALGVTIHVLRFEEYPSYHWDEEPPSDDDIQRAIIEQNPELHWYDSTGPDDDILNMMLLRMLTVDPTERPTAKAILKEFPQRLRCPPRVKATMSEVSEETVGFRSEHLGIETSSAVGMDAQETAPAFE
jgi:serine/threonine protein kinase